MNPIECIAIGNTGVEVTHSGLGGGAVSGMVLADGPYRARGYEEALRVITLTRMSHYRAKRHLRIREAMRSKAERDPRRERIGLG